MAEKKANRESRAELCGKPGLRDGLGPGTQAYLTLLAPALSCLFQGTFPLC